MPGEKLIFSDGKLTSDEAKLARKVMEENKLEDGTKASLDDLKGGLNHGNETIKGSSFDSLVSKPILSNYLEDGDPQWSKMKLHPDALASVFALQKLITKCFSFLKKVGGSSHVLEDFVLKVTRGKGGVDWLFGPNTLKALYAVEKTLNEFTIDGHKPYKDLRIDFRNPQEDAIKAMNHFCSTCMENPKSETDDFGEPIVKNYKLMTMDDSISGASARVTMTTTQKKLQFWDVAYQMKEYETAYMVGNKEIQLTAQQKKDIINWKTVTRDIDGEYYKISQSFDDDIACQVVKIEATVAPSPVSWWGGRVETKENITPTYKMALDNGSTLEMKKNGNEYVWTDKTTWLRYTVQAIPDKGVNNHTKNTIEKNLQSITSVEIDARGLQYVLQGGPVLPKEKSNVQKIEFTGSPSRSGVRINLDPNLQKISVLHNIICPGDNLTLSEMRQRKEIYTDMAKEWNKDHTNILGKKKHTLTTNIRDFYVLKKGGFYEKWLIFWKKEKYKKNWDVEVLSVFLKKSEREKARNNVDNVQQQQKENGSFKLKYLDNIEHYVWNIPENRRKNNQGELNSKELAKLYDDESLDKVEKSPD